MAGRIAALRPMFSSCLALTPSGVRQHGAVKFAPALTEGNAMTGRGDAATGRHGSSRRVLPYAISGGRATSWHMNAL